MAGHNKWSKVKHRKAVVDKRRGKVWTKVAKAIIVAAKHGGGDPSFNVALRYALDEARYANMPRDVIDRAIQKGTGGTDMSSYEAVRYEGYAPGGVAVIVDALTDNRTRTITDVRNAFSDAGGNVGNSGCVAYMFDQKGLISISAVGVDADKLMEAAIEAGALDVEAPDADDAEGEWVVATEAGDFHAIKDALEKLKLPVSGAELAMVPQNRVEVRGEPAAKIAELIEALEDLDDVQKVYTNAEYSEG